jgi:hypothetical protein
MHLEAIIVGTWEMYLETTIEKDLTMTLEAMTEQVWRCTCWPRSINSEMHFEADIKLNSEMQLEAVIQWVWRCNCRPQSS